jgi:hypothetical protein
VKYVGIKRPPRFGWPFCIGTVTGQIKFIAISDRKEKTVLDVSTASRLLLYSAWYARPS